MKCMEYGINGIAWGWCVVYAGRELAGGLRFLLWILRYWIQQLADNCRPLFRGKPEQRVVMTAWFLTPDLLQLADKMQGGMHSDLLDS